MSAGGTGRERMPGQARRGAARRAQPTTEMGGTTALQSGMHSAKVKATEEQKSERWRSRLCCPVALTGAQGFQPQLLAQRLRCGGGLRVGGEDASVTE